MTLTALVSFARFLALIHLSLHPYFWILDSLQTSFLRAFSSNGCSELFDVILGEF